MTNRPVEADIVTRSVKLYPRLAITTPQMRHTNVRAVQSRSQRECAPGNGKRNAAHSGLQARLLRMIVENERLRRHEQRPNAS
jgi:hypothetical protein